MAARITYDREGHAATDDITAATGCTERIAWLIFDYARQPAPRAIVCVITHAFWPPWDLRWEIEWLSHVRYAL